jgi:hypothetical protein
VGVGSAAPGLIPAAHGAVGLPEPTVASAPKAALPRSAQNAPLTAGTAGGSAGSGGGRAEFAANRDIASSGSSVEATRIVKTGNLELRVPKKDVPAQTDKLVVLAASEGGYVASSSTNLGSGAPYGEVVLRIPVARFEDAIKKAQALGHTVTLTTSADDVTGKYVDLAAKRHALEQTRSTYLSILSRARTIGATLAVQQRIDDVQQQIDQLSGQIKLLGSQSSYSTLTVDVVPSGLVVPLHHAARRHGIGKAWHDSWRRFSRGVDAMVGAIGPIVFALLLFGLIGLIGWLGNRSARRLINDRRSAASQP